MPSPRERVGVAQQSEGPTDRSATRALQDLANLGFRLGIPFHPSTRQDRKMRVTRLATIDDAPVIAELIATHREFFAPWDPLRDEEWYTAEKQRIVLHEALQAYTNGMLVPMVILDGDKVIGRISLNGITRGALQSAALGYWVSPTHHSRGFATRAVCDAVAIAFGNLGLHRVQAETLLHNVASQNVLLRNGFCPYGVTPESVKIAGSWQDHLLFHLLNPAPEESY